MNYRLIPILLCVFLCGNTANAQVHARFENQISSWFSMGFADPVNYQAGGRYMPALSLSDSLKHNRLIDAEISVNAYGNAMFTGDSYNDGSARLKPYRAWIRYSTPRLELRAGLQKINFGSATILRPLMWFDKMDFRDPLQLTDGVYAFLGRYYFKNNANLWAWVLYGNKSVKGWESLPTRLHTPEFGGRLQVPFGPGEVAVSYHHRQAEYEGLPDTMNLVAIDQEHFPEDRISLDGRWDVGIGLWAEAVLWHNGSKTLVLPEWETFFNIGGDYTVGVGNGINLTAEFFRFQLSSPASGGTGTALNFIALAASYPLGIMNTVSGMVYYNPDLGDWYRMVSIQRKYDFWSFYLLGFWNPERMNLYNANEEKNLFSGAGFQLMAVVNF
jgi:hypothetical protein